MHPSLARASQIFTLPEGSRPDTEKRLPMRTPESSAGFPFRLGPVPEPTFLCPGQGHGTPSPHSEQRLGIPSPHRRQRTAPQPFLSPLLLLGALVLSLILLAPAFPVLAEEKNPYEGIIEYFDEPEDVIVIDPGEEESSFFPAPGEQDAPSSPQDSWEQQVFAELFALNEPAPRPEGDQAYLCVPITDGEHILAAGTPVRILGREGDYMQTDHGYLPAGSLSSTWQGPWSPELTSDSESSGRYLSTLYEIGCRIPAPLRQILFDYTIILRSKFLDDEALPESEATGLPGADAYGLPDPVGQGPQGGHPESILGSVLGLLSISPEDGWQIHICAIPERMDWIFFHEFGHALDVCYLEHTGAFLSEDEGFTQLIATEGQAFDENLPYLGEHPDGYECLAELIAAYYCEPRLLQESCPGMYGFAASLETTPVWEWSQALPREEIVIVF